MKLTYNISINCGEDYWVDFAYTDDDEIPVNVSGWYAEATLREYAESPHGVDFYCLTNDTGIHLYLPSKITKELGYSQGEYDVLITDPDNNFRVKLISGRAFIRASSTH